jgi:hypothetical protein
LGHQIAHLKAHLNGKQNIIRPTNLLQKTRFLLQRLTKLHPPLFKKLSKRLTGLNLTFISWRVNCPKIDLNIFSYVVFLNDWTVSTFLS